MDSFLRLGAKTKKKISQSRKAAKGIGSLLASLRLCEKRKKNRLPYRTFKKNLLVRRGGQAAKPAYRR